MRRIASLIIVVLFFIWILPLGAFIKPSQEKKACNGKRAICLCSHLVLKQLAKMEGKAALKKAHHSSEKERGASTQPDFIHPVLNKKMIQPGSLFWTANNLFYNCHFVRPIEHIPIV